MTKQMKYTVPKLYLPFANSELQQLLSWHSTLNDLQQMLMIYMNNM